MFCFDSSMNKYPANIPSLAFSVFFILCSESNEDPHKIRVDKTHKRKLTSFQLLFLPLKISALSRLEFKIHDESFNFCVYSHGTCISYQWYCYFFICAYEKAEKSSKWNLWILVGESSKDMQSKLLLKFYPTQIEQISPRVQCTYA